MRSSSRQMDGLSQYLALIAQYTTPTSRLYSSRPHAGTYTDYVGADKCGVHLLPRQMRRNRIGAAWAVPQPDRAELRHPQARRLVLLQHVGSRHGRRRASERRPPIRSGFSSLWWPSLRKPVVERICAMAVAGRHDMLYCIRRLG